MHNKIEKSYKLLKSEGVSEQKTLFFETGENSVLPGQFYMLNYNVSQKPFSVSHNENGQLGITILKRGKTSEKMVDAKEGEYFGLTGPLGNYFETSKYNSFLLIGGGIGTAPVYILANYLAKQGKKVDTLLGARTEEFLRYTYDLKENKNQTVKYYTDDNTGENQGFVTQGLDELLKSNKYDTVCMCGPEVMMVKASETLENYIEPKDIQISMERYMKCGIGLCGSCVLDDIGLRVCEDGPVFTYETLKKSKEFGKYHRNSGGVIEYR